MIADCKYCSTKFTAKTYRKLFCSDRCKVRYNRENSLTCFYCGDLANTRDHITPHSTMDLKNRKWSDLDYVNCCKECNSLMSNFSPYVLTERIRTLIYKFTKKYKLHKPRIQWDEEELEEMSGRMAKSIRGHMRAWNSRQARLDHMRLRMLQVAHVEDEPTHEVIIDDDDDE